MNCFLINQHNFSDVLLKEKNNLIITSLNKKNKDGEDENNKNICGYIAQEDDHLFFQPDEGKSENIIFHNDEIIKKSVWLKSGDIIQIKQKIISYIVSGDRVQIIVTKKPETTIIIPPSNNEIVINNQQQSHLTLQQQSVKNDTHGEPVVIGKTKKIKSKFILLLLFVLSLIAVFILFAETAMINIKPEADNITLNGIFPVIKLNERYIIIRGKYELKSEKKGYRALNKILNINSTNKEFIFTMKENPGFVQFDIVPEDNNKIYIDELLLGDSIGSNKEKSLLQYEVDKGEYTVTVVNSRYKKYEQKIKNWFIALFSFLGFHYHRSWCLYVSRYIFRRRIQSKQRIFASLLQFI